MRVVMLFLAVLAFSPRHLAHASAFDPGRAGFTVDTGRLRNPYRVLALFAMPGETLRLKASADVIARAPAGILRHHRSRAWTWKAPRRSGLYPLELRTATGLAMTLNAFVLRPASDIKNDRLEGYRIGSYPAKPFRRLVAYRAPRGYIEATPENVGTRVSPHFTLGQFLCKQASGWPKFLVLREELLLKLETVLQATNEAGYRADTLFVMSGYRTPFYNKVIGNGMYSRHIYDGGADVYVDVAPRDGVMDDLNKDGKIDRADAALLYDIVERLSKRNGWRPGGLGEYGPDHTHGPFVHVDARGFRARWGRPARR
jgi:hypothetical protein